MVQESPSDSTRPPAEGRRLGGGAIASLSGVGLLVIFMVQNTQRVRLDFLFWTFTWPLWLLTMASALLGALVWLGLAWCAVTGVARSAAEPDGADARPALVAEPDRHHVAGLKSLSSIRTNPLVRMPLPGVDERGAVRGMCQSVIPIGLPRWPCPITLMAYQLIDSSGLGCRRPLATFAFVCHRSCGLQGVQPA
jgi:uncharacterized integral membrane protein